MLSTNTVKVAEWSQVEVFMEIDLGYGTYAPVKTPYMGVDPTSPFNE